MLEWNHSLLRVHGQPGSNLLYVRRATVTRTKTSLKEITYTLGPPYTLLLLDTVTGHAKPASTPPLATDWIMDQQGEARLAFVEEARKSVIYYRRGDGEQATWERLSDFTPYGDMGFMPVGFGPDGALYVAARQHSDMSGLFRYDLARHSLPKDALLALDGYDFLSDLSGPEDDTLVMRNGKLVGLKYLSDVHGVAWLDSAMGQLQQKVDALLAYGSDDQRVPLYHGEKFYAAVKAGGNQNVEWVAYEKEGHGWKLPKNRYDWWQRVEQFLAKNIGEEAAK